MGEEKERNRLCIGKDCRFSGSLQSTCVFGLWISLK